MAKIGNVVDAETAIIIAKKMGNHISRPGDPQSRAVIWPQEKASPFCMIHSDDNAFVLNFPIDDTIYNPPQRPLTHLICTEDWVIFLSSATWIDGKDKIMVSHAGRVAYDFSLANKSLIYPAGYFIIVPDELRRQKYKRNIDSITEAKGLSAILTYEEMEKDRGAYGTFLGLAALEHFAFSPYSTTRLRPSKRILSDKIARQYAAIEIVNLRLPEKIENPESTGKTINIRYWVTGHLRKITDRKTGEKRLVPVREHIRGPKDAPLKPKTEKVYKVTR